MKILKIFRRYFIFWKFWKFLVFCDIFEILEILVKKEQIWAKKIYLAYFLLPNNRWLNKIQTLKWVNIRALGVSLTQFPVSTIPILVPVP